MDKYDHEDINDVLSSIMQGQKPSDVMPDTFSLKPKPKAPPTQKHHQLPLHHSKPQQKPVVAHRGQSEFVGKKKPSILEAPAYSPASEPIAPKAKRKLSIPFKKLALGLSSVIVVGSLGFGAFFGISRLLEPRSPFTSDVTKQVIFPLYFPTDLPAGYKIELDSVRKAEDAPVILLGISDENNQRITISQQKQPSGLNFENLNKLLTEARQINTQFGNITIGVSDTETEIANVLTGDTWILISTPKNSLKDADYDALIRSFRQ
jgi:hypothetical protein